MPLRDHFNPPLDDHRSWDELHGMWPATIVTDLSRKLPSGYYAAPNVHLGSAGEVEVGTFEFSGAPREWLQIPSRVAWKRPSTPPEADDLVGGPSRSR